MLDNSYEEYYKRQNRMLWFFLLLFIFLFIIAMLTLGPEEVKHIQSAFKKVKKGYEMLYATKVGLWVHQVKCLFG